MRVAFFYPERTIGRPIDPSEIWASPRGLTGSEIACVMYALELSRMGHGVTFFSKFTRGVRYEPRAGVELYAIAESEVVGPIGAGA